MGSTTCWISQLTLTKLLIHFPNDLASLGLVLLGALMIEKYPRGWDGKQWEAFSLVLVRLRHDPTNVQPIPDRVKGDYGIECITTDGCCYQSYAPLESADVAKAASAMKAKAKADLNKIRNNAEKIKKLLNGKSIKRWILLCPFLDDKAVVETVATKASELKASKLEILSDDFEALVHCQDDFSQEIDTIRKRAVGTALDISEPSDDIVDLAANDLDRTLDEKLGRGFPELDEGARRFRKHGFISTQIRADNALEQLKRDAPELWEQAMTAIGLEESRLQTVGSIEAGSPNKIMLGEQDRLFDALKAVLPTISSTSVQAIAQGQIGTWLIECPLDFTGTEGGGQ